MNDTQAALCQLATIYKMSLTSRRWAAYRSHFGPAVPATLARTSAEPKDAGSTM